MFSELIKDPFIDPSRLDGEELEKPRKLTVIFSAFHKILYAKEKLKMKRAFNNDLQENYIDFENQ